MKEKGKETQQPEQWYRLDLAELSNGKEKYRLSGYYKDLNVAIVIGENEGYNKGFKLVATQVTSKNKSVGITDKNEVVFLTDQNEAKKLAIWYAHTNEKSTCASRAILEATEKLEKN